MPESEWLIVDLTIQTRPVTAQQYGCVSVSVPRVATSPAALECKLWKVVELPKPDNADASIMVVGTITGIHIDDTVVKNGKVDVTTFQPLARLGYMDYARITNVFSMKRPNAK